MKTSKNTKSRINTKSHKNTKSRKNKTKKRIFSKKDFSDGDGMLVSVWGPAQWHFLHTMSFNYPVKPTNKDKKHYRDYMLNLVNILPCKHCRENLKKNYKVFPLTMDCMKDRNSFSRYVYRLHERINKNLGKDSGLTYCDVRERYEHFRARCLDEKTKKFVFKKTRKNNKENGCTEPLYGKKAKCIIKIVPKEEKCKTFQMDEKCKNTR
tara:strand:+ start:2389 stop:3015 length:627 start_codon:yes stop_codon:yes gene_type:complete